MKLLFSSSYFDNQQLNEGHSKLVEII